MDNRRSSEPDILKTFQLLAKKTIILVEIVWDNLGTIIVSKKTNKSINKYLSIQFLELPSNLKKVTLKPEKLGQKIFEDS